MENVVTCIEKAVFFSKVLIFFQKRSIVVTKLVKNLGIFCFWIF